MYRPLQTLSTFFYTRPQPRGGMMELQLDIYRKRYGEPYSDTTLFGIVEEWRTANKFLTDDLLSAALRGEKKLSYYTTSSIRSFALDVDDHVNGGWADDGPTDTLISKYERVVNDFSPPSFVARSPRGIHCFYSMTERLPTLLLQNLITRKIRAEFLPTMTHSLRLPSYPSIIHPVTLSPVDANYQITIKTPHEIFLDRFTADYNRQDFKSRIPAGKISGLELQNIPSAGNTNGSLCRLGLIYRAGGLGIDQACERFALLLEASGYRGELNNYHRLRKRMEGVYRAPERYSRPRDIQPGLFDAAIVDGVMDRITWKSRAQRGQRFQPIRRFVAGLVDIKVWHDCMMTDPGQIALMDYLYKFYRKNRREGYYPLPQTALVKLNDRYNEVMAILESSGIITPSPYQYSARLGICKYYRLNF